MPNQVIGSPTVNDLAFLNAARQQKAVVGSIKNWTMPCLPNSSGYADTAPAVNIVDGTQYQGANLLILKEHQKRNCFTTAEYISEEQVNKARLDRPRISIKQGEEGISIFFNTKDESSGGGWESKYVRLFNVAQASNPWEVKAWANEQRQEKIEFLQKAPEAKQKQGPEIVCSSSDPAKYLGQYFAAVTMGRPFKASTEMAVQFAQKMEASLTQTIGKGHINPFQLSKISNEASLYCKDYMAELKIQDRRMSLEHKVEHTQTHGLKR
jgi:hypothetical protein